MKKKEIPVAVVAETQIVEINTGKFARLDQSDYKPRWDSKKFGVVDVKNARNFLQAKNWSIGMQEVFIKAVTKLPLRFWIIDDSGSMLTNDGNRRMTNATGTSNRIISCTRWSELTSSLKFHVDLIDAACVLSEFRFINQAKPLVLGDSEDIEQSRANKAEIYQLFEMGPSGQTPLCFHIREIIAEITVIADRLKELGQKACVIICTDGESTDGDLAREMQPLQDLPVIVVVRLCTDEDLVVQYWNDIDEKLEVDIDVLDDFR